MDDETINRPVAMTIHPEHGILYVLCDNGTVWRSVDEPIGWKALKPIPDSPVVMAQIPDVDD